MTQSNTRDTLQHAEASREKVGDESQKFGGDVTRDDLNHQGLYVLNGVGMPHPKSGRKVVSHQSTNDVMTPQRAGQLLVH